MALEIDHIARQTEETCRILRMSSKYLFKVAVLPDRKNAQRIQRKKHITQIGRMQTDKGETELGFGGKVT